LLQSPMFLDNDYDETVDQLWGDWYNESINLMVQNKRVYEKWRTEWSVKDNSKFSCVTFIVEYIQAHSEEKRVGLLNAELEKLQGKKLSTLEIKLKAQIKLAG
jgi:hypothetical protein